MQSSSAHPEIPDRIWDLYTWSKDVLARVLKRMHYCNEKSDFRQAIEASLEDELIRLKLWGAGRDVKQIKILFLQSPDISSVLMHLFREIGFLMVMGYSHTVSLHQWIRFGERTRQSSTLDYLDRFMSFKSFQYTKRFYSYINNDISADTCWRALSNMTEDLKTLVLPLMELLPTIDSTLSVYRLFQRKEIRPQLIAQNPDNATRKSGGQGLIDVDHTPSITESSDRGQRYMYFSPTANSLASIKASSQVPSIKSAEPNSWNGKASSADIFGPFANTFRPSTNVSRSSSLTFTPPANMFLSADISGSSKLYNCSECNESLRTASDLEKHMVRHNGPHTCNVPGCRRAIQGKGFATIDDLQRHTKSVHRIGIEKVSYRCTSKHCRNRGKIWPRFDNFKQHIDRMHKGEDEEELIRNSKCGEEASPPYATRPSEDFALGLDPTDEQPQQGDLFESFHLPKDSEEFIPDTL